MSSPRTQADHERDKTYLIVKYGSIINALDLYGDANAREKLGEDFEILSRYFKEILDQVVDKYV
jgi:hypothetical protein